MCCLIADPLRFLVPTSEGLSSPGILYGVKRPCSLACLTKWILLSIWRVLLVSLLLFIMQMALLESVKRAIVTGESGWRCRKLLNTCFVCSAAVRAKAQALYSASALDRAIGVGTNEAESTSDPNT